MRAKLVGCSKSQKSIEGYTGQHGTAQKLVRKRGFQLRATKQHWWDNEAAQSVVYNYSSTGGDGTTIVIHSFSAQVVMVVENELYYR